jgi:hypothetical protein
VSYLNDIIEEQESDAEVDWRTDCWDLEHEEEVGCYRKHVDLDHEINDQALRILSELRYSGFVTAFIISAGLISLFAFI